jgi:hypothetical protein
MDQAAGKIDAHTIVERQRVAMWASKSCQEMDRRKDIRLDQLQSSLGPRFRTLCHNGRCIHPCAKRRARCSGFHIGALPKNQAPNKGSHPIQQTQELRLIEKRGQRSRCARRRRRGQAEEGGNSGQRALSPQFYVFGLLALLQGHNIKPASTQEYRTRKRRCRCRPFRASDGDFRSVR